MRRAYARKLLVWAGLLLMLPSQIGCALTEATTWQFPWERRASYQEDFMVPPATDSRYSQFPRTPPVDKDTYLKSKRKGLFDDWLLPNSGPTRPKELNIAQD